MYSRTILLAAASLAVSSMMDAAMASPRDSGAVRQESFSTLQAHHHRRLSDPYFFRDRHVMRSVNACGRVALVEIHPRAGAFVGRIVM